MVIGVDTGYSAANDFWGKTFLGISGQTKMNQEIAILTGSSAGATESFVVVPFELVKIKYVTPFASFPNLLSIYLVILQTPG